MKKTISIASAIIVALCIFVTEGMATTEEVHGSSVLLDQEQVLLNDPLYMKDGRVFVPLRFISDVLDVDVNWHQNTSQVEMKTSHGDRVWFNINSKIMDLNGIEYVMDVQPFIENGRTYLPLKHVMETLHIRLSWDSNKKTAHLTTAPVYVVEKGDSLEAISAEFSISVSDLKTINRLDGVALNVGQELKVIAPNYLADPLQAEDVDLLARIIFIEAGHESYEGQVAVGNVIINRVQHSSFPDTIRDVIYHPGQFPPAHNGKLEQTTPSDSAIQAARAAIGGTEYATNALYFFNPRVTTSSFFTSKPVVATIGNHRFVR